VKAPEGGPDQGRGGERDAHTYRAEWVALPVGVDALALVALDNGEAVVPIP